MVAATEPSPVKVAAEELGLPVRTPDRAREVTDEVAASGADVGVVVAFGQLLPEPLFTAVPLGFVNVHFSLLPRWRGAAPVERAILAGDTETGVCVMAIEEGLDTGAVYARAATPIGDDETAGELRARLVALGTDLLVETVPRLATITPQPQAGEPTSADKLTVEEFELDFARPAAELVRRGARGQPAPRRVDDCRRPSPQGVAGARRGRRATRAPTRCNPKVAPECRATPGTRGHHGAPIRFGS